MPTPDKAFINNFLKINGVSSNAPDEDITSVLKRAKWSSDEIKTAILVLRGTVDDTGIVAVTKHDTTLFSPELNLSSKQLSRLLGVDVIVDPSVIKDRRTGEYIKKKRARDEIALWTIILLLATILALVVAWILLFTMKIGPYREMINWVD